MVSSCLADDNIYVESSRHHDAANGLTKQDANSDKRVMPLECQTQKLLHEPIAQLSNWQINRHFERLDFECGFADPMDNCFQVVTVLCKYW